MAGELKQLDYTYEQLRMMRDILIEELKESMTGGLSVEHLKLIELRLQTMLMAGLTENSLRIERVKFKYQLKENDAKK